VTVRAERAYPDATMADHVARAIAADNPAYVHVERKGSTLKICWTAPTPRSARATGEDLFACIRAAELTLRSARRR
jgi:putative intracellular protease/amidase